MAFLAPYGLSLQARGTRVAAIPDPANDRFIPAGAGNTSRPRVQALRRPVYPRRCGEHLGNLAKPTEVTGLSPQVRGTHSSGRRRGGLYRFIPAGAGNTSLPASAAHRSTVYPRRCGEHTQSLPMPEPTRGLSPQVRGTHWLAFDGVDDRRFIPAGAGNTVRQSGPAAPRPVYPRRCGEHLPPSAHRHPASGLSPQVRGTQLRIPAPTLRYRFIPAGAGNTDIQQIVVELFDGLSPQVRGTREYSESDPADSRFIPAGAGNTDLDPAASINRPVYPRRCGEHVDWMSIKPGVPGLSPQVRGTRWSFFTPHPR